jgi:hypothetical protein
MFLKKETEKQNNLLVCKQTLENDECKTDIYEFKNEIDIAYIEGPIYTMDSYVAIPII